MSKKTIAVARQLRTDSRKELVNQDKLAEVSEEIFYRLVLDAEELGTYWRFELIQKVTGKMFVWGFPEFNDLVQQAKEFFSRKMNVIYTAWAVKDPQILKIRYSQVHPNIFYHHSTNRFGKQTYDSREGELGTLRITGRLTTDKVDVLLVLNEDSMNQYPHITLSVADGVRPAESNGEIARNLHRVKKLDDFVKVKFINKLDDGSK